MYELNPKLKSPLHKQLYEALKKEIHTTLKVGDKLPSIRKVASLYNLSKNTVESAYSQLYVEGYVESFPKRGYFVSEIFEEQFTPSPLVSPTSCSPKVYDCDFFPAQLSSEDFPLKTWRRISHKVLNQEIDFGAYPIGQGELALREEILKYLMNFRGVSCSVEQIIITHGFSDSMGLLAKLVKKKYAYFGIENPGYHLARRVFEEYGYHIERISVGEKGINIEELKRSKAQVLYITPSHQYPTGVRIPIKNRMEIINHMTTIDGLIIEDDYDSELAYRSRPIPSLQGLDNHDIVAYLGTFSKSLSPSIRIGYMVLPNHLLSLYQESYDWHFARVSIHTQNTLAYFMKEGHYERHIRKIRTINRQKHNLMRKILKESLGKTIKIVAQDAGLAILIQPTIPFNWKKLQQLSEKENIKIYLAKERSGGEFEAVRMGFGGLSLEKISKGVEIFCEVWKKSLV